MKRSKFTDNLIIDAVKRVEAGIGVPDIYRELGISTATFYKWRAKYSGMDVYMMSRMKELEDENRRLKKKYHEEKLNAEIVSEALEKKVVRPSLSREVDHKVVSGQGLSFRAITNTGTANQRSLSWHDFSVAQANLRRYRSEFDRYQKRKSNP
jgi:putative transposase